MRTFLTGWVRLLAVYCNINCTISNINNEENDFIFILLMLDTRPTPTPFSDNLRHGLHTLF